MATAKATCPVCGKEGKHSGQVVWCPCSGWIGSEAKVAEAIAAREEAK
jgi:hypothetical protein